MIKCLKHPNRMQVNSAELGSDTKQDKGSNSDASNKRKECRLRVIIIRIKVGVTRSSFRGRGRGNNPSRGGHQLSFCETQTNRKVNDTVESIYQSKADNSINSDSQSKDGICYFLKSRLPTAQGTVNGKEVIAMRDTGCTGCVIRRSLVSSDQLLGKESDVTLINETTQRFPLAMIDIDCPFFTGQTEAICMDDTLYDLVIGNIDGSKLPDMSHFCAAVETRSQAKEEKKYRKLKVPDQIIYESKEEFQKAQATDANLENIRRRVEDGNVTVSRGLNRGETKLLKRKICCIGSLAREIRLHCSLLSLKVFVKKL